MIPEMSEEMFFKSACLTMCGIAVTLTFESMTLKMSSC